jgi:RHS repeat-associated protein
VAGRVVWAAKQDPWGNVQQEYNPQGIHQAIRLPGQHHDRETGLYYNRHRYYDPAVGSYVNQDPIGLKGGASLQQYGFDNPIKNIDPTGLEVYLCKQPAFGIPWNPIDHHWLKTDSIEAGMGPSQGDCGNAGNGSGDMPGDLVQVCDHSGREKSNATCEKVLDVNEDKVNELLKTGKPLGRWGPTNQCQAFVREVIEESRTSPRDLSPFDNPFLWGF